MKWMIIRRTGVVLTLLLLTVIMTGYGTKNNRLEKIETKEEKFSINVSLYVRKIWVVEEMDEKKYTEIPLSLVITRSEEDLIEGYLAIGELVSKYYFDLNNSNSNKLLRFHGRVNNHIAECKYGQNNAETNKFEITFCEDDKIIVSVNRSGMTDYQMRPYNIADIEQLSKDGTLLEAEIRTWGIGRFLYTEVAGSNCLFLIDKRENILFQFLAPYNIGEELQDIQVDDRDGDGLEDIKIVVGYFSDWDNRMHCQEWWFYQEKDGGFSLGWTGHYQRKNSVENKRKEIERQSETLLTMTSDEVSDYLMKYARYDNYAMSIHGSMTNALKIWFPNLDGWTWDIIEKVEKGYIADITSYTEYGLKPTGYKAQILIKPDFSIELLPETIEVDPEQGFCIYATRQEFINNGCRMETYRTEYYNSEKNIYLNATIPLFSLKDGMEWNEVNCAIWGGLKKWVDEQEEWENGEMMLDYEIMRQDNNLFSVLLSGEWKPYAGEVGRAAMGMTVSMSSRELLEEMVFIRDGKEDSCFKYYIKDNEVFIIENETRDYMVKKEREVEFEAYSVDRRTAHVYGLDGGWKGICYYDLLHTGESAIDEKLREDMGHFFNGLAQVFKEEVAVLEVIDDLPNEAGYHCIVESKLYRNNGKEFGIEYHYKLWLEEIHEEGDAVICFDVESGEILEYQDWQSEMMEKIKSVRENK